jgi:hypothetical protein
VSSCAPLLPGALCSVCLHSVWELFPLVAFAYCTARSHLVLYQLSSCLIQYVCNMILKEKKTKALDSMECEKAAPGQSSVGLGLAHGPLSTGL